MAGIGAPHARGGIDDLAPVDGKVMHVLGAGEQPWRLFEGPVGREWHPVRSKVIGNIDAGGARALVQHGGLFNFWAWGCPASYQLRRGTGTPQGSYFRLIRR